MLMELDDLKLAWQALDRRLERQQALDFAMFRTGRLATVRAGLRPLMFGQGVQLLAGAALMAVAAPYWVAHRDTPHLVAYGLLLHAYGLMLALFAGRDLVLVARVDYAAPVLEIQKQLATLRAARVQAGPWFALAGCVVWVPAVLMVFQWLGADVWVHKPAVVAWFAASSAVCIGFTVALIAWVRRDAARARVADEGAAGRGLARAQAMLDEIARFETE
jgi:hypothetical protein